MINFSESLFSEQTGWFNHHLSSLNFHNILHLCGFIIMVKDCLGTMNLLYECLVADKIWEEKLQYSLIVLSDQSRSSSAKIVKCAVLAKLEAQNFLKIKTFSIQFNLKASCDNELLCILGLKSIRKQISSHYIILLALINLHNNWL